MRCMTVLVIVTLLFLAGCKYEAPLTKEHTIPVDLSVLGVWEPQTDKDEASGADERMMILKYSDTEYLIHYPPGGNDETYYNVPDNDFGLRYRSESSTTYDMYDLRGFLPLALPNFFS